jgi:hypothetical protein
MIMMKKYCFYLLIMTSLIACTKGYMPQPIPLPKDDTPSGPNPSNNFPTVVTVDASKSEGNIMQIERANVHSTTGKLPGERGKQWLQGLGHTTIRTWIQLRFVYNKGNLNYNYKYGTSDIGVEESLAFHSECADSLLIALTAYTAPHKSPLLPRGTAFQNFVKETLLYYKRKYPKIKYIQVGNEPDYNGETVAQYYPVYKDYYKAINAVNTELGLGPAERLLISNGPFTSVKDFAPILNYTAEFLDAYRADTDPQKRLDYFSFNCYTDQGNPKLFETAKPSINALMQERGLPIVPVYVTEFGLVGGNYIPTGWNAADMMSSYPAAQLSKAFYLYEGGIDKVFNWSINHSTIAHKSQFGDLETGILNPYGHLLTFGKELSSRQTRINAVSTNLTNRGLGINAIASMGNDRGMAVIVWNYNWTNNLPNQNINVKIDNIPAVAFGEDINAKVYILDSKNNNYFTNASQTALQTTIDAKYVYEPTLNIPLTLEKNSVALIVLTP